jgi:hypothetical protein
MNVAVQISVTAQDIAAGCRMSSGNCPVALAIKRVLNAKSDVGVCSSIISIYSRSTGFGNNIEPPQAVTKFIREYDAIRLPAPGHPYFEPFTFELWLPAECLKEAA